TVVQRVVFPRWQAGERQIHVTDVHRLLDDETPLHPEIERWAYATRNRLASNILSTLRDYGLLRGASQKEIVEPIAPPVAARHLASLLAAEGLTPTEIAYHPDWKLWLWSPERAAALDTNQASKESIP
ncbi:MAG: BrxA family protein, partial [Caldilinea sp.]